MLAKFIRIITEEDMVEPKVATNVVSVMLSGLRYGKLIYYGNQ